MEISHDIQYKLYPASPSLNLPASSSSIPTALEVFTSLDMHMPSTHHIGAVMKLNSSDVLEGQRSFCPVSGDQYSINLMWISESSKQRLLGDSEEELYKKFVEPVSSWAWANPDSIINFWYDGETTSSAVLDDAVAAPNKALDETTHCAVSFRNIRSISTVVAHPTVFGATMPFFSLWMVSLTEPTHGSFLFG